MTDYGAPRPAPLVGRHVLAALLREGDPPVIGAPRGVVRRAGAA